MSARQLQQLAGDAVQMLLTKVVRDPVKGIAGWHNNFAAGRIGTTGSALPLMLLGSADALEPSLEAAVVRGLVDAQVSSSAGIRSGWAILSVAGVPTVEGTAPTLMSLAPRSGADVTTAVSAGRQWLEAAQNGDGGWGSTEADQSRTCLTASAVFALSGLDVPPVERLARARTWLTASKRADGSWGPRPGQAGTVVHTALAIRALLAAGAGNDDAAVRAGVSYLGAKWRPDPNSVEAESYDATVGTGYQRVSLSHDVDAEVVMTLVEVDPQGVRYRLWDALAGWVRMNRNHRWWDESATPATLWTVVPRARVALHVAQRLGSDNALVRSRPGAVVFSDTSNVQPILLVALLSLRSSKQWLRYVTVCLSLAVAIGLLILLERGGLDLATVLTGIGLPVVMALIAILPKEADE